MQRLQGLINGTIPDIGVQWFTGLMIILGIAVVMLIFIREIKTLRKKAADDMKVQLEEAKVTIKKDVEIDQAIKEMATSLDRLTDVVCELRTEVRDKLRSLEINVSDMRLIVAKVENAVAAAHHRMDEHRKLDHGLENGRTGQRNYTED